MDFLRKASCLAGCAAMLFLSASCRSFRPSAPTTTRVSSSLPSRVVFLIGDGMGAAQVEATREVLSAERPGFRISFEDFPVVATQHTRSASSEVTDSAASATAMACGARTVNGYLGVTPSGSNLVSIATIAHDLGWKVGLLTSQSMDHATPAGFYAHTKDRRDYPAISGQLAETPFDFIGGGALRGRFSEGNDYLASCASNGYLVVRSREAYPHLAPTSRVFAVTEKSLPKFAPAVEARSSREMRLRDFTEAALNHFGDSPFFLMVEGGQIDSACHNNDLGTMVREVEEFDEAVRVAVDFARTHPDVLIVVTADHETGGLERIDPAPEGVAPAVLLGQTTDGPAIFKTLGPLAQVKAPFNDVERALSLYFGEKAFSAREMAALRVLWEKDHDALAFCMEAARLFAAKAGYRFTAGNSHTGVDVPVYCYGAGASAFAGLYDNTSIFDRFKDLVERSARQRARSR